MQAMRVPTDDELKALRERYPAGTMIRLLRMQDPYSPVPSGTIGTVDAIDDMGSILMRWANGSQLALIENADEFDVLPTCPKCGKQYAERPALSREDSRTSICPMCGYAEAVAFLPESERTEILRVIAENGKQ